MKRSFLKRDIDDPYVDESLVDDEKRPRKGSGEFSDTEKRSRKMSFDITKDKYENVEREILNKEITMNDIFKLELSIDEYVWFMEHLRILRELQQNTLERYRIKTMIYDKYNDFKNINISEFEKLKSSSALSENIVQKIINSNHPDYVKAILYKKYRKYYDNGGECNSSDELFKIIDWIENVLDLPTKVGDVDNTSTDKKLEKLWKELNSRITGLINVKEQVMEAMCAKLLDSENKGKIITFVGPPGVGKTAVALSIAESIGLQFDQISFGSIKDSSVLTGHSSTYIGAIPGLFTKTLLKFKQLDFVLLLDEIDKIPQTAEGHSIASVLYHVLDRTQNDRFKDMYMPEILLDLSKIIFLASANSIEDIDYVLKDRMTIIEMPGYSIEEKIDICENHTFERVRAELGFKQNELKIGRNELKFLISMKTENSPGMRNVEKKIYQLCERLALLKHTKGIKFSYKGGNIKFPLEITTSVIQELL